MYILPFAVLGLNFILLVSSANIQGTGLSTFTDYDAIFKEFGGSSLTEYEKNYSKTPAAIERLGELLQEAQGFAEEVYGEYGCLQRISNRFFTDENNTKVFALLFYFKYLTACYSLYAKKSSEHLLAKPDRSEKEKTLAGHLKIMMRILDSYTFLPEPKEYFRKLVSILQMRVKLEASYAAKGFDIVIRQAKDIPNDYIEHTPNLEKKISAGRKFIELLIQNPIYRSGADFISDDKVDKLYERIVEFELMNPKSGLYKNPSAGSRVSKILEVLMESDGHNDVVIPKCSASGDAGDGKSDAGDGKSTVITSE